MSQAIAQADPTVFYIQWVQMESFFKKMKYMFKLLTAKAKVHLDFSIEPGFIEMEADIKKLRLILTAVLDNAIKCSSEGSHIMIHLSKSTDQEWCVFDILDTGVGNSIEKSPCTDRDLAMLNIRADLELQGGNFQVANIVDGSTFMSFRLPTHIPRERQYHTVAQ